MFGIVRYVISNTFLVKVVQRKVEICEEYSIRRYSLTTYPAQFVSSGLKMESTVQYIGPEPFVAFEVENRIPLRATTLRMQLDNIAKEFSKKASTKSFSWRCCKDVTSIWIKFRIPDSCHSSRISSETEYFCNSSSSDSDTLKVRTTLYATEALIGLLVSVVYQETSSSVKPLIEKFRVNTILHQASKKDSWVLSCLRSKECQHGS